MAHWRKLHLPDPRSAAKALCGAVGVDVRRLPGPDVEQYVRLFGEAAVRERRFYNVGAGGFSHPCWTNVDYGSDWYGPVQSNFVQYDLLGTDPLPVADGTAEIVYSSHTIEHIPEDAAQRLFNEAYRVLSDETSRAAYLCELHDAPIDAERNTAMPADFLVRQLEWREAIDEVRDSDAREPALELAARLEAERDRTLGQVRELIDERHDYVEAATLVRQLMFYDKLQSELRLVLRRQA